MNRIFVKYSSRGFLNEYDYREFSSKEAAQKFCDATNDGDGRAEIITKASTIEKMNSQPRGEFGSPILMDWIEE